MREYEVKLNNSPPKIDLNILPLGSYDVLIGMDRLEQHHVMLDCLYKSILCTDRKGNHMNIQGIHKKVFIWQISSLEVKRCIRKGYKLFAVSIKDVYTEREQHIEDFSVLVYFKDVFPEEIQGLPPKRDLDFSIEMTPRSLPASKSPYRMSALELVELKLQLQELIEKGYIQPSMSPWGAPILFIKK